MKSGIPNATYHLRAPLITQWYLIIYVDCQPIIIVITPFLIVIRSALKYFH